MTEWAPTFACFVFFTVSTVCPMSWYSHHRSINCDTRRMGSHQLVRQPYEDRGALRGTPGSAYPQPEPNATELPSSAPGRPLRRRTNYLEPQRLRPLRHAPNTSPGCRSCASAPSPAAPAGVREEHYSRSALSVRNLSARNRDAAIVRCRCDGALGLPWCCSAHAC